MNFAEFLESPLRNEWLVEGGMQIYVRKHIRHKGLIDLANMNARKPGKGNLRAFLAQWGHLPLRAENVLNDRLADFFRREGWTEIPCQYEIAPSFMNAVAVEQGFLN